MAGPSFDTLSNARLPRQRDLNGGARRAVHRGIVDQVSQQPPKLLARAPHQAVLLRFQANAMAALGKQRQERADHVATDLH